MKMRDPDFKSLVDMHCHRRPADSKTEIEFIRKYIYPLGVEMDDYGNISKRIGRAPVLWSSHTDTVHRKDGMQKVKIDGQYLSLDPASDSNCLGSDDSAGIWLMREMILAKKPGLYIFHRCEEIGGLGSDYIARSTPNALYGIKYAIAFDRRGTDSVITHQAGGRCASDTFGRALAKKLGNGYRPDCGGVFTDTANYTGLVPECTNISVGYYSEHSKDEKLDVDHLFALRHSLLEMDVTDLPVERDPSVVDDYSMWGEYDQEPLDRYDDVDGMARLIKKNPHEVARIMQEYGITCDELAQELYARGGAI